MAITDADLLPEVDVGQLIGELYLPFPADVIKVRPAGTGNKPLSYVSHPHYTRRLDRIFPMAWSFSTEVVAIQDNACGVKESLSITLEDGRVITRESYGHSAINKRKPLGDALKSACSDALKKSASLFGVGLYLYTDDDEDNRQTSNGQHTNGHYDQPPAFNDDLGHDYGADPNPPPREQGPERYDVGDDPSPATSRQIIALQNISKSNKTDPALAQEIKTLLTTPTEHNGGPPRVSKAKASELISRAFDK